jgi:hypothetical protein
MINIVGFWFVVLVIAACVASERREGSGSSNQVPQQHGAFILDTTGLS